MSILQLGTIARFVDVGGIEIVGDEAFLSSASCAQVRSFGPGGGVASLAIAGGPNINEAAVKMAAAVNRIFMVILFVDSIRFLGDWLQVECR